MNSTSMNSTSMTSILEEMAGRLDCVVLVDGDGDFCLLERHWLDGVQQTRLYPEPRAFHPIQDWLSASPEKVKSWIY
jgi:hypothetical protein